jgi:predicted MFS family arabinose efflux permease
VEVSKLLKRSLRLQIILIICVRMVFNTMHRMVYPYLSYFAHGMGVDLATLTTALLGRSLAGFFSPLFASVADNHGRKAGMLLGTTLFTVGVSLVVFKPTFPAFFLTLVLTTLGYMIFIPAMQAHLGDQVPYEQRGLVMALSEMSWSLSFILGVPLMGFLISSHGWMAPFPLLTILGLFSLALLARILPPSHSPVDKPASLWAGLRRVFTHPPALAGLAMVTLYSAANETINVVFGVWIENKFAFTLVSLGAASLGIGLAELCGEALVGGLTDRLGKQRAVAIGLFLNCLAALSLLLFGGWLPGALGGLFLFYLTFEFTLVSGIPLMSEVLPPARATLMASHMAFISLGRALGDILAPALFTHTFLPGITANVLVTVGLNVLAAAALRKVTISPPVTAS